MHYCCEHDLTNQLGEQVFSEKEQDDYLALVFIGLITTNNLSVSYDFRVKAVLERALIEGFGATLAELTPGSAEFILLESFEDNLSRFTAAKQYQQVRELEAFKDLKFAEFRQLGVDIFQRYNQAWLNTEFETVVNAASSGRKWTIFEKQKDSKPFLTYHTQQDSRVRPEHQTLDGITRPVDDSFWDSFTPPNGWNCRCFLTSSATAPVTPMKDIKLSTINNEIPEMFKFNPGKTGLLFSSLHPYYSVKRGDTPLKRRNFNIPV